MAGLPDYQIMLFNAIEAGRQALLRGSVWMDWANGRVASAPGSGTPSHARAALRKSAISVLGHQLN